MSTKLKESMRIVSHQIDNTNRVRKYFLNVQIEILELKTIITEMKIH